MNRDCVLVWLISEWDETLSRPNKAAEEERTSILRIFSDVVDTLSVLEHQRRQNDAAAPEDKADLGVVARPTWLTDVAVMIKKAAHQAGKSIRHYALIMLITDPDRLELLSKMLLKTSAFELKTESLLALTGRLDSYKKSSQASATVEHLFNASLNLAPTNFDLQYQAEALQGAIDGLRRRVTRLPGQLGDWSRKQVREAIFE